MEMLLYAVGQDFVFVLYTSMAQITVSLISIKELIITSFRVSLQLGSLSWF
jgi:hypothetical protein